MEDLEFELMKESVRDLRCRYRHIRCQINAYCGTVAFRRV